MNEQMRRGVSQSLYKYLPESWIDFTVRGEERNNYIAQVVRWNSEKLDGINTQRLLRVINQAVRAYEDQASVAGNGQHTNGFGIDGDGLTADNCAILTPKHDSEERGIVARISPLTFYCPKCHKVYQFRDAESYLLNKKCRRCHIELKQMRQIYFCKCGWATDKHRVYCSNCKSSEYITWGGKLNDYDFWCTRCKKKIPMVKKCEVCGERCTPSVALDPAQYFAFSTSLIDIIDEKVEHFISKTDYGPILTIACWMGKITREELLHVIECGMSSDPDAYKKKYDEMYVFFKGAGLDDAGADNAAKAIADKECGSKFVKIVNDLKGGITSSITDIQKIAEMILEYMFVLELEDHSTLEDATEASKLLNTSANPESFKKVADRYAISAVQVCGDIPFITCSYGYTRKSTEPESGAVLHAFKEEKSGTKNVYATKLRTEGVLFEFDRIKILKWLLKNGYIEHSEAPDLTDDAAIKLWFANNIHPELIKPFNRIDPYNKVTYYVYNLIHTLSHLLIRSAARMCGLDKNSISEYIMVGVPSVLIYCQNSQGFSLGALFNVFEAYFDKWIESAYNGAKKCIFDPVCIERHKACTGCLFLNEVSCQHFNHDLDRSLVIGAVDRASNTRHWGFWEE